MTVTSRGLYAYLTILSGNRAGTNFPLDARRKTLIGRGTDCHISLADPLCSRVHATLTFTPDGWVIRDGIIVVPKGAVVTASISPGASETARAGAAASE